MKFKLKVRRGARALVMLIDASDIAFHEFAVGRCSAGDFEEALHDAQSRVALPTFLLGGDYAITAAEDVLDLRGVVAWNASDAVVAAASRLQVPLLLIGGSTALASAAPDASRITGVNDAALVARLAARFINAYA
jgi:hypothetical protein